MLENTKIKVYNETADGMPIEVECDVLLTFDSDLTGKSYMVYTDNTTDSDGKVILYASCYTSEDSDLNNVSLSTIETDAEWDLIEEAIQEAIRRVQSGQIY